MYRVWTIDHGHGVTATCHTDWLPRGQCKKIAKKWNSGFVVISKCQSLESFNRRYIR